MKPPSERLLGLIIGVFVLGILVPGAYGVVSYLFGSQLPDSEPFLERPEAKYERCVKETTYMRYHHMELLREVREQVVRSGIRGEITLDRCRDCHSNRSTFCNRCHDAVSLNVDCFGCHYYPEGPKEVRAAK